MTDHAPDVSTLSKPWRRLLDSYLVAILLFVVVTVVAMWPAMSDLSNTIMGSSQPGDATGGGVRLGWLLTIYAPFGGHSPYLGAPEGLPFWAFTLTTSIAWILPQWLFAHLFGGIASWNLDTALGFVLDGLAMYGLTRWLTGRAWLGLIAGLLYSFSPFHVEESYAHIGYVWTWTIPLILWAALLLAQRPTIVRGVLVGAVIGIGGYVDPYYLLFGPMLAAFLFGATLAGARSLSISRVSVIWTYTIGALVAFVCTLPLAYSYVTAPASSKWLVSSRATLRPALFQRANLWEYFVPWGNSPLWGHWTRSWVHQQLGQVQPIETSLYLGGLVIVLFAAVSVWFFIRAWRSRSAKASWEGALTVPLSFLVPMMVVGTIVFTLCSFAYIGPVAGFPTIVWDILPLWRVFTRLDAVIDCFVIVGACIGLIWISESRFRRIVPLLAMLVIADGTAVVPWESWSYAANTPAAYTWLADHQDGGIVAEYPMLPPDLPAYIDYSTYQEVHHHPLFNGALPGSLHAKVERGVADIDDPQTLPTLRRFGVRYVVISRPLYDNPANTVDWAGFHVTGLSLIEGQNGVRLYHLDPGPVAAATLAVGDGFGIEHPFLPQVSRWMGGSQATLKIDRFGKTRRVTVSFVARSYKFPQPNRELRVYQGAKLLWRGQVTEPGTLVRFKTSGTGHLTLICRPGSVHVPGFLDRRSIDIIDLNASSP